MPEAVIVATARSPIGRAGKGSLTSIRPDDLAVQMVSAPVYAFAGFAAPELRIHPHTLQEGEEIVVARRLREALTGA